MFKATLITTVYPAPTDDEEDYCPDGESEIEEYNKVNLTCLWFIAREYGCLMTSSSDGSGWLHSESEEDYRTGERTEYSLHITNVHGQPLSQKNQLRVNNAIVNYNV